MPQLRPSLSCRIPCHPVSQGRLDNALLAHATLRSEHSELGPYEDRHPGGQFDQTILGPSGNLGIRHFSHHNPRSRLTRAAGGFLRWGSMHQRGASPPDRFGQAVVARLNSAASRATPAVVEQTPLTEKGLQDALYWVD